MTKFVNNGVSELPEYASALHAAHHVGRYCEHVASWYDNELGINLHAFEVGCGPACPTGNWDMDKHDLFDNVYYLIAGLQTEADVGFGLRWQTGSGLNDKGVYIGLGVDERMWRIMQVQPDSQWLLKIKENCTNGRI